MLEDLRAYQKEALDQPDHDMQKHLDLLDKKDLKTTGWLTTPLDNVDHDFVSPLLNNYLKDIEKRMAVHDKAESGMAANLRKATKITDSEELVNIQYQKVASLKEQADQKEHELELERIKNEHNKKVKRLVRNKIDFKKNKGFRRQNSYLPELDEFGDIDDADNLKINMTKMRRSLDFAKKREVFNVVIKDVCVHRLEKDIMAQSVSDSMGQTGFMNSGGMGGAPTRKKRAADSQKRMTGTASNFNSTGGLAGMGGEGG